MKYVLPLLAVKDINVSRSFYENVMRQNVTLDLGWNIAFNGQFALQMNYAELVEAEDFNITYKSNDHELYFEDNNLDGFIAHLDTFENISYIHKVKEYPWGQRVIRFYDPDFHVIEVGDSMESVFKRLRSQGLSIEEIAEKTMHPAEYIKSIIN